MHTCAGRLTSGELLDWKRQVLRIRKDKKTRNSSQDLRVNEQPSESIAAAVGTSKFMTEHSRAEAKAG